MTKHFVSKTCEGEHCSFCESPATHKVGEESYPDHPASHPDPFINAAELAVIRSLPRELQDGHNLTAYVCCSHFRQLMGRAAPCEVPKGHEVYLPPGTEVGPVEPMSWAIDMHGSTIELKTGEMKLCGSWVEGEYLIQQYEIVGGPNNGKIFNQRTKRQP
jgi:hypothetical protein